MPVYLIHGFRWPREGFTGVRVHAIVHNLEDCSVEYIQNPNSKHDILTSLRQQYPDVMKELEANGRSLDFIEQHDPHDLTSDHAVSQPHAFVADKVVEMGGLAGGPDKNTTTPLSLNVDEVIATGPGLSSQAWEALAELRDKLAAGEKIGWWVVYNGDPDRAYESDEDDRSSTPTQASTSEELEIQQGQDRAPDVPPKPALAQPIAPSGVAHSRSQEPIQQQGTAKALPAISLPQRDRSESKKTKSKKDKSTEDSNKSKEEVPKTGFRKKFFGRKA